MNDHLNDQFWLDIEYRKKRRTLSDIASELSVDPGTVSKRFKKFNIKKRSYRTPISKSIKEKLLNYDWCIEQYNQKNKSLKDIDRELGVYSGTVRYYFKKHGIKIRSLHLSEDIRKKVDDKIFLMNLYQKMGVEEMSKEIGIPAGLVYSYLKKAKIKLHPRIDEVSYDKLNNKNWLYKEYVEKRRTGSDIGRELGVYSSHVLKYCRKYGFDIRKSQLPENVLKNLENKKYLELEYIKNNRTMSDIGRDLGVDIGTIKAYLELSGIKIRECSVEILGIKDKIDNFEWLDNNYRLIKKSSVDIAKELNVSDVCVLNYLKKHKIEIRSNYFPDDIQDKLDNVSWLEENYITQKRSTESISNELGINGSTVLSYLKKYNIEVRKVCQESDFEKNISEIITGYGFWVVKKDRKILKGKEIDILIPEKNIGIECNGMYWHSYSPLSGIHGKDIYGRYHLNKTIKAKEAGIKLLHVSDYEWNNKQEIIKSIFGYHLGILKMVNLLECEFKEYSFQEAEDFFNKNHLGGMVIGTKYVGLSCGDQIMMAMVFDKEQVTRMAFLNGFCVNGGIQKILERSGFTRVIAKSDLTKFDGSEYLKAGLTHLSTDLPDFIWWKASELVTRKTMTGEFLKERFDSYDDSISLDDNAFALGYRKYFDCGRSVYLWDKN